MAYEFDLEIEETEQTIDIDLDDDSLDSIDLEFGFDAVYTGSYEVSPAVDSYTLSTANKTMLSDIVIEAIPYSSVSNTSGGLTVTIA